MAGARASFSPPPFAGRTHGVRLEVADVLRRHGEAYLQVRAGHVGRSERRVMGAITACRTSALGGHVEACDDCGATRVAYNSCLMGRFSNGELARWHLHFPVHHRAFALHNMRPLRP
jgi:Transposase zinc-binding domain